MLKTKRSGDMACGVFLALLGVGVAWAATTIGEGAGGQLHPRTFPMLLGVLLFLGGGLLAGSALAAKAGNQPIDWPDRRGWACGSSALAALVLYVALSPPLGFLLTSFFFVSGFIWYFGRYTPVVAASWALGVVAFLYVVFVRLLDLTLPLGPLSFLG